jgi:hypothetical protein
MKINLWGVRGSIPTFNPDTIRYGGNTSCIEVEEDGHLLVLDAGSGITKVNIFVSRESMYCSLICI